MTAGDEIEAMLAAAGLRYDSTDPMAAFARDVCRLGGIERDEVIEILALLVRHGAIDVDRGIELLARHRRERADQAFADSRIAVIDVEPQMSVMESFDRLARLQRDPAIECVILLSRLDGIECQGPSARRGPTGCPAAPHRRDIVRGSERRARDDERPAAPRRPDRQAPGQGDAR